MDSSLNHPHSAVIRMSLRASGHALPVAQMGPDFVILKTPLAELIAPCPALISLNVDGQTEEIPVTLPDGIAPGTRRVAITEEADVLAGV